MVVVERTGAEIFQVNALDKGRRLSRMHWETGRGANLSANIIRQVLFLLAGSARAVCSTVSESFFFQQLPTDAPITAPQHPPCASPS